MRNEFPEPIDPAAWTFDAPLLRIQAVWPFCERCRYVIPIACRQQFLANKSTHDDFQSYILYRTTADLAMGIERECWICLRAAEKQYNNYSMPIVFNLYVYAGLHSNEHLPEITIFPHYIGFLNYDYDALRFSIKKSHDDGLPSRLYKTSKQHTRNKDDPQIWRYLRDQLDICMAGHSLCSTESSWVPTRLVEIARLGEETRYRVVLTKELTEKKPYISLSHRWGDNLTLRLTKHTYDKYSRKVPPEELPQKYIDAAVAAQKLKIEYLWIDSLVITLTV